MGEHVSNIYSQDLQVCRSADGESVAPDGGYNFLGELREDANVS